MITKDDFDLSVEEMRELVRSYLTSSIPPCHKCKKPSKHEAQLVITNVNDGTKIYTIFYFCNSCKNSIKWSAEDKKGSWVPTVRGQRVYFKTFGWTEICCNVCLDKRVENRTVGKQVAYVCNNCLNNEDKLANALFVVRIAKEYTQNQFDVFNYHDWDEEIIEMLMSNYEEIEHND